MNKLSKFMSITGNELKKHSSEILIGVGIAGMLTTTVLAVKGTPKALKLIEEKKKELDVDALKPKEILQTTWKCYIPAAVTCVVSVGCLIGASSVNARRNAALATAYSISESALKEYKEKVVETVGKKKEQSIRDEIAKDKVETNPIINKEVIITSKGETLCFDSVSGRYFKSDIDKIKRSVNELNRRMISEMYISLNDYYMEIGLDPISVGDDIGWNIDDGCIEPEYSTQLASDGTPCLVIGYLVEPRYDYAKNW